MKGILFKPDMIRAIVDKRKTVTRRVIKPQPKACTVAVVSSVAPNTWQSRWPVDMRALYPGSEPTTMIGDIHKPRYRVGEVVYIKEAWATEKKYNEFAPRFLPKDVTIFYVSDGVGEWPLNLEIGKLRSPMFLKVINARYFLKINDVRPERLQEITFPDIIAEGVDTGQDIHYQELWNSINPKYPFESNPWVWRYEFRITEARK